VHQQQENDLEAIRCFERAVGLRRSLDRAWFGLGLIHRRRGENDRAVKAFKTAADLQPMNPYAWQELAMAQLALGNLQEVRRIIRHVSDFDPQMTRLLIRDTGQHPEDVKLQ
jgi:Flp pilus assembly protein TadD